MYSATDPDNMVSLTADDPDGAIFKELVSKAHLKVSMVIFTTRSVRVLKSETRTEHESDDDCWWLDGLEMVLTPPSPERYSK